MTGPSLTERIAAFAHEVKLSAHALWFAVRDGRTPWPARVIGVLVTAYAFSPIDLIPDFIPVLGLLDDLVIVPAGLWAAQRMIPAALWADYHALAVAADGRPTSRFGVAIIAMIWAAALWLVYVTVRTSSWH
jgi:uncharacterized membrane protein YkvA (DUF1232 family)